MNIEIEPLKSSDAYDVEKQQSVDELSSINSPSVDKKYECFKDYLSYMAEQFSFWDPNASYRLISHLDADGVSAASIMIKLLTIMNRKYTVSILPYLDKRSLEKLKNEGYDHYIFLDLGSGHEDLIKELFSSKFVMILDHHEFKKNAHDDDAALKDYEIVFQELKLNVNKNPKLLHANPHMFDIDGGTEISGAGITFLFSRKINREMDKIAHIAIVGAIGDVQEDHGFRKLNNDILSIAIEQNTLKVIQGLRLFAVQTRPLHKVLEYCTDPYLPGISGNESGALQFLYNLGINPKSDNGFKKLIHLSENDQQKLVAGIMLKTERLDAHKIIGPVYILRNELKESPTRDATEFSTLLNACGRLQKASLGIGVCLNVESIKKKAFELLSNYKQEIVKSMKWVEFRLLGRIQKEASTGELVRMSNAIIINARNDIKPTMIGTVTSIFSRSNLIQDGTFLLGLSRYDDGNTKVSLRAKNMQNYNLKDVLSKAMSRLQNGETGGHNNAAGAVISTLEEDVFIDAVKKVFDDIDSTIKTI